MRDESAASVAETTEFAKAFTALGGDVVGTSYGVGGFGGRFADAASSGTNTIFAAHTGDAATALLAAYRSSGLSAKLIAPGSLTESIDLAKIGGLPRNVYTSMFYAPDLDNEENRRFVSNYQNTYGAQPSSSAMAAYDAAGLIDRAIRLVQGDLSPARLKDALKVLGQISSPRGTWTFNTDRSPQQTWYLRQLRLDGQVVSNLLDSDLAVLS
jgi:branched-chain amino acid transport system substrate-binding protein